LTNVSQEIFTRRLLVRQNSVVHEGINVNRKLVGAILTAILTAVLVGTYFLFNQPKQTMNTDLNTSGSTSPTSDSALPDAPSASLGASPSESSNEQTSNVLPTEISFPNLSVPEFTLLYADHSYDVPATYKFDEYTGKTVVDRASYRVKVFTIDITIKNQPFSYSFNGTTYNLYYGIRTKGHFGENWYHVNVFNRTKSFDPHVTAKYVSDDIQSNTEYTVIHYPTDYFSKGDQLDIQVQAVIGHTGSAWVNDSPFIAGVGYYEQAVLVDVEGDWSSTQTITIDNATILGPIVP